MSWLVTEVAVERDMHARFPDAEREELVDRFCSYGADLDTAVRMAAAVSEDPELALQLHTREELGVNPNELPSPLLAGEPRWWRSPSERSCRCCRTFLAYAP